VFTGLAGASRFALHDFGLRRLATGSLDPNVWFGNIERVAWERIGPETVTYVSNIFKYYITRSRPTMRGRDA